MDEKATVWCKNIHMGAWPREDITEVVFNTHILRMIDEGFQIVIIPA